MDSFVGQPIQIGGRSIFVNPGTGPIDDASLENAKINVAQFIKDIGLRGVRAIHQKREDRNGRFAFYLYCKNRRCFIEMPGIELERVRYMSDDQDPWQFPRLYVDGSSWLWKFALNCSRETLTHGKWGIYK